MNLNSQKIYLVRHGQTDYNLQGIVQGSGVDASINATGRAQSRAFYEAYRDIPFERIYTSKLKRSQESVELFAQLGIPTESHLGLNEISWGTKEGQKITPEEDVYYHWMLMEWQEGKTDVPIEKGESPDEVAWRQRPFLELLRSRSSEKNVLICMHGRAMRILLCQLLNYPIRSMDMFEHENLGLYLIHYSGTHFTIELYNNSEHLVSLKSKVPSAIVSNKR